MKAVVCEEYGPPSRLRLLDVPVPAAGPRQVLILNRVAAVNFPDTLMIQGKYQLKPPLPFSPGCELAGIVTALGAEVTELKPGDTVVAMIPFGAYAQQVAVDVEKVIALPAGLSDTELELAGALTMTYGTSLHALQDRADVRAGETLLVLGAAGGVGLAAVELGKLMNMRVIAAASSQEKLAIAREYGADEVIDYSREDLRERIKALVGAQGVDVVYDPVGGDLSEAAVRSMGWNGRYLVVGFAAGTIAKIPLNLTLLKGCALVGVFWGEFVRRERQRHLANMRALFDWLAQKRIRPLISGRYPLSRAGEALEAVLARRVIGKVVILPGAVE